VNRPFVFINSAMSADGKISTLERRQVRISGKADLARVDALRAESDAVMVGIGTVLADDPSLRVKSEHLRKSRVEKGLDENPLRVVADSRALTPLNAQILGQGCVIAVSKSAPPERVMKLSKRSEMLECGDQMVDLARMMSELRERGVKSLMVEGGATLNWSLIREGLVDEIYVYIGPILIGGRDAPTILDGAGFSKCFPRLKLLSVETLDDGTLLKWRIMAE
jgi:2,5-diamino-6-(ribosylamino)-4(3H)-pyrimidinone 5'-phosphate reductase